MKIDSARIEIMLAERQMTRVDLSKRCGISRQNLSTIIRRGTCEPLTAGKIAKGFGVDVEDLVFKK